MKYKFSKYLIFLFLFLVPGVIKAAELNFKTPNFLETAQITTITADNLPWEWEALSPAYQYSFAHSETYDPSRPIEIRISYDKKNNNLKQIFSFDQLAGTWQPLLTSDDPENKFVTAVTTATQGKLIVLANPDVLTVGTASWYKYKNGLFAASPDFKKGSILKVINLSNNKSIDVTINDFGPERAKHPDRVIDLDYVAFKKLAPTGSGLIKIKIEPQKVVTPVLNQKIPQLSSEPNITASSAVIMLEKDGTVLWGKNANQVSPLASLTKLVAMRVFLDTRPSLDRVVAYKKQDENYNYQYCRPGEAALLKVKEGETLTLENLIYSALVGSANNAVETLVRVSGLTRSDFIKKMNETVKNWGALNTNFSDPTGLDPKNVSSPYDYAIITKEVFTNPLIKKISTVSTYTFSTLNTKKAHRLTNTNQLVRDKNYPIIGSKTGYLDEAGYCLMTLVKIPANNLIVVNFGSKSKAENFLDNEQLIRYGLRQLKFKK
ncbi:MAG: RlpA-like double-psi beta-barrel domain-containing protein [Patescibacteria group bacterium]